jgi:AGZA family xanthine/uracil permease-like MFS transporter
MATGVVIALLCFFGMFGLLGTIFPTAAIVPILLYIGLLIGAQAFQATPRAHAAAVVAALIPNIAQWVTGMMDNALSAAGTDGGAGRHDALAGAGVVYDGLKTLGEGAILAGLVLGAIVAFIIDKRSGTRRSSRAPGAVLTFVGLIHAEKVQWNATGQVTLGYLFLAGRLRAVRADQAGAADARRGRAQAAAAEEVSATPSPRRPRAAFRSPPNL